MQIIIRIRSLYELAWEQVCIFVLMKIHLYWQSFGETRFLQVMVQKWDPQPELLIPIDDEDEVKPGHLYDLERTCHTDYARPCSINISWPNLQQYTS